MASPRRPCRRRSSCATAGSAWLRSRCRATSSTATPTSRALRRCACARRRSRRRATSWPTAGTGRCSMPTGADGGPRRCDLLVRNAHVLTLDERRTVFLHGAVAIDGRDIAAVGPEREVLSTHAADRVIDAHGAVVHPGLVESHY